ncbi:MAG TPA: hypothetical protein VNU45_16330 [Rummeliibacillus sp.]|nr:hypothetical protein [Rummeliibacillus sp.]
MKNLEKIKNTHQCFNCGHEFEWKAVYFNPPITPHTVNAAREMEGNIAKLIFTSKGVMEIEVACDECFNLNRFTYSK